MSTVKKEAIKTIEQLPDDCTVTDIFERLLFLERIREGEEAANIGNFIDHNQVEKRFSKWLQYGYNKVDAKSS